MRKGENLFPGAGGDLKRSKKRSTRAQISKQILTE
jgi:hypothetical protein